MSRATTQTLVLVALSFCCGAVAMKLWSAWQFKTPTSCEALLSQQHIPNPFQLTGNNCAVMDVSKGYRADEPTTFPPESTAVWRGAQSKSWVGMGMRSWCRIARNAWALPPGLFSMLRAARWLRRRPRCSRSPSNRNPLDDMPRDLLAAWLGGRSRKPQSTTRSSRQVCSDHGRRPL